MTEISEWKAYATTKYWLVFLNMLIYFYAFMFPSLQHPSFLVLTQQNISSTATSFNVAGSRIITDFHFDDQLSFMATHNGVMVTCYDFRELTVIMRAPTKIFDQYNYVPWCIVQYCSCGCGTTAHCQDALGMENGQIADTDLSASSSFEMGNVGPQNGR